MRQRAVLGITSRRGQAGFSLLEILTASFIGFLAMVAILYLYKSQHKNMRVQDGISQMRMNGQYALNESEYYLGRVGLGLPSNLRYLMQDLSGDLIIMMNSTKKYSPGTLDGASNDAQTVYSIPIADTAFFSGKSYAFAHPGAGEESVPITSVAPQPGRPGFALLTLACGKGGFQDDANLFPVERVRLHLCTGSGADTLAGDFRVLYDDAGKRQGLVQDTLTLAEGLEVLAYRFFLTNNDSTSALPASLQSIRQIEVRIAVKSQVRNRSAAADGYARDTLRARVNYRRSF